MEPRKPKHLYPHVGIPENGALHTALLQYCKTHPVSLHQAILAILGDWAEVYMQGNIHPFAYLATAQRVPGVQIVQQAQEDDQEEQARLLQEQREREEAEKKRVKESVKLWV